MSIVGSQAKSKDKAQFRPGKRQSRIRNMVHATRWWLDERTDLVAAVQDLASWRVPEYVQKNLLYSLGGLTLISIVFQIATGILQTFYYEPSTVGAYNSVDFTTYQAPLGWLVRGIHYYNASAIVILVFLHTLRTFSFSSYKKPHEITWLSGVVLLVVVLGFAFTGYLLPWDQKGYWGTVVGTEIPRTIPLIGETISRVMRGGSVLGQLTLTRFYIIHTVVLPITLILFIVVHLAQYRRHGAAPTLSRRGAKYTDKTVPAFPDWVTRDLLLGLGLLALLVFLSTVRRVPLDFPADPTSTDHNPRPEWYFLFLFQMLRYIPPSLEPVAVVLIPTIVLGSMALLPFLDTSEERRPWRKPVTTAIGLFYVLTLIVMTLLALRTT
jgi:ubiquinol-cytochrome c reductase cytochrome b subunit